MVFSELTFLTVFLPAVAVLYYLCPRRAKNCILLISSLAFYGWGEPGYLPIMLVTIVMHYSSAILIEKLKPHRPHGARAVLVCSISISLALLGVFKYSDFAVSNVNSLFGLSLALPALSLPIGISFYTFQTLSYTIDVYRGVVKAQKNIINLGTYVSFFPQLIAGPIVQYKSIGNQLTDRPLNYEQIMRGISRFTAGLCKKVLLANKLGEIWAEVETMGDVSALTAWIGILCFTLQIYFDFSGYSDMAIGLGRMFGFEFTENFNYPYCAKSVTDFWRRWHITLGSWFREYVYIPLGGNRCSKARLIFNIFVVWFLTGLWHGAGWNFILWGVYFGVLLSVEKLFLGKLLKKAPSALSGALTILAVIFGWVLFSADSLSDAVHYLSLMFGKAGSLVDANSLYMLMSNLLVIVMGCIASTPVFSRLWLRIGEKNAEKTSGVILTLCLCALAMVLCIAFLVGDSYNPFLYFRF